MGIGDFLIVGIVLAAFMVFVVIYNKKHNEKTAVYVSELSEEDKNNIMDSNIQVVKKNVWTQKGYICDMQDKGNKMGLYILWYDTVMSGENPKIELCNTVSMKKDEIEKHGLKKGSYITIEIAPERTNAVRIIFE